MSTPVAVPKYAVELLFAAKAVLCGLPSGMEQLRSAVDAFESLMGVCHGEICVIPEDDDQETIQ